MLDALRRKCLVACSRRHYSISGHNSVSRNHLLEKYSNRTPTPVSIQQMLSAQRGEGTSQWLQTELLIRLSRRYQDMHDLPVSLIATEHMKRVLRLYYNFFEDLSATDPQNNQEFIALLGRFYVADSGTLPSIAMGMREWQSGSKADPELNARLDDLFTSRLSTRMLIGQHLSLERDGKSRITRGLVVSKVAEEAADSARRLCLGKFGVCPEIVIEGSEDFKFTYVDSHLHHMIFELTKNSVRAVVEQHHGERGRERRKRLTLSSQGHLGPDGLPPVRVAISGGKEDVVIKVSDEGGGIPRSEMSKIWSYEYTTAHESQQNEPLIASEVVSSASQEFITFRNNFYGMGYGLPIARVFARYFGGDLKVISTEGWGTDAYVFLNRLESTAIEVLPE